MKKFFSMLLAILMLLSCFTACGAKADSDMAAIKKKGTFVVGITEYEPMDYLDENGQWIGFDAEFAQLLGKEMGVEVEFFVLADWGKKFYELEAGTIDAVWNGMTLTEEAQLNASCSDPYVVNAQVVVMKADVVGNYTDAESLKDLTFAVENGSAGQSVLDEAGITGYVTLQDQAAALMEVAAGTSDACVIDITMARAMTGEGTSYADLAIGMSLSSEEYGVAFRKDSDLTDFFNKTMEKWMQDGTLDALAAKYNVALVK